MTALKSSEADSFIAKPDRARPIVLIYGPDAGLVRERAEALIRASVENPADVFSLIRIEGDELSGNPYRLVEEANTIPMFGGRRAVWVRAGSRNIAPAVEAVINAPSPDCRVVIEAGDLLTPARLALAATAGVTTLDVRRRVRVAIISTGDELAPVGVDPGDTQVPASNALMLAAILAHLPVDIRDYGIVPDDKAALTNAFRAVAAHDIIVTSGGASVGDHDLVRPALTDAGAALDFWKIAMRPGKPLMAGMLGDAIVLGLPGNPVSAFVTATLFLKPLIARLSGAREPGPAKRTAPLGKPMPAVGARADYVRGIWRDHYVVPLAGDSGMLVPLARAEVLIIRPAGAPPADEGDTVEIITLA